MTPPRATLIRAAATMVVVVVAIAFLYVKRTELHVLTEISLPELGALVAAILAFFVVSGWIFYLLVSMVSVELSPREWFGVTILTNALNYLGPARPGVLLKAVYLKSRQLPFARFSSVVAAGFFLSLLFTGTAGLAVLALVAASGGPFSTLLSVTCVAVVLVSGLPLLVPLSPIARGGRLGEILSRAIEGFRQIRRQRGKIAAIGVGMTLQHLVGALCYLISFHALGFRLDFLTSITLGIFASLSNIVAITPNNIGVQEVVMAYIYSLTGMDFTDGILGAGLVRGVHLLLAFGLAPLFAHLLPQIATLRFSELFGGPAAGAGEGEATKE